MSWGKILRAYVQFELDYKLGLLYNNGIILYNGNCMK